MPLVLAAVIAAIVGAYFKRRNDVLIGEFKQYDANMLLTYWGNQSSTRIEGIRKGALLFSSEPDAKKLGWAPHDYGPVSTNRIHLTTFKGPTGAQEQYRLFLDRFGRELSNSQ